MFKSKRSAGVALILPAVLAGGTWLFLSLGLEIPMYVCALLSVALTEPKVLYPGKEVGHVQ